MKRVCLNVALLLLACMVVASCSNDSSQQELVDFEVDVKRKDLGRIDEGQKAVFTFTVTNTGQGPIELGMVRASCGCAKVDVPKKVIEVGQSCEVKIIVDTSGRGGKFAVNAVIGARPEGAENRGEFLRQETLLGVALIHRTDISWADPPNVFVKIRSWKDVAEASEMNFRWKTLADIHLDAAKTKVNTTLGEVSVGKPKISILEAGFRQLDLPVRFAVGQLPPGKHYAKVSANLVATNGQQRQVVVAVTIEVLGAAIIEPRSHFCGRLTAGEKRSFTFTIKKRKGGWQRETVEELKKSFKLGPNVEIVDLSLVDGIITISIIVIAPKKTGSYRDRISFQVSGEPYKMPISGFVI